MSQQPVWLTQPGSLGTVPEGRFYKISLYALDPDCPLDLTQIEYTLIAGDLPQGVAVNRNGTIEGIPVSQAEVKGVPFPVAENTTSKFTIRATISKDCNGLVLLKNLINDRTFTLTITGQDVPEFVTPAGQVGYFSNGQYVSIQIETKDDDPTDILVVDLIGGQLPNGLTIDKNGLITGYVKSDITADSEFINWDKSGSAWSKYPWDFRSEFIDKNYEFTLEVSDGKNDNLRTFSIFISATDGLTVDHGGDTTRIFADNIIEDVSNSNMTLDYFPNVDTVTVDQTNIRVDLSTALRPYLTYYEEDFGRIRHDNFYAYEFVGLDPISRPFTYEIYEGELPPGLYLDGNTGWITGYLDNINLTEETYNFTLIMRVEIDNITVNDILSIKYPFIFTLIGNIETEVTWLTPTDIGPINNGEISTLYVEAVHETTVLNYRLKPGSNSKLPQGLQLQTSGNIVGRVSFKMFSLDTGTTTFDADFETRLDIEEKETTFDRTYIFWAEAFSSSGIVSVSKEFHLYVNLDTIEPYTILYAKAMPPTEDRSTISDLISDSSIMDPEILYRLDDNNFGVSKGLIYEHAYGLTPEPLIEYVNSFEKNHYKKVVTLGEIKTAQALDNNGNILYEVVYSHLIDDMVNQKGESVSNVIDLNANAINHGDGTTAPEIISKVYPNSFENMRNEVINKIGQISKILPRWMLSKQIDNQVLGFVPAWVIAYTKPTKSDLLAYKIRTEFTKKINTIDFTIDRFILDESLSKDWEKCDTDPYYVTADSSWVTADDIMTVDSMDPGCNVGWKESVITTFDRIPALRNITADSGIVTADSNRYINVVAYDDFDTNDTNNTFDIDSETIYDGGSCRFISPIDVHESTEKYNKYIMFPKVTITDSIPIKTQEVV